MGKIVALRLQKLPERDDLGVERRKTSCVFNDIVCVCCFFRIGNLVGETEAGIGFGSLAACDLRGNSGGIAGDFDFVGRGDDDDAVNAPAPIGQHALFFAAGAGVAHHLEDERRLNDGYGCRIVRQNLVHPMPLRRDYGGMDNGVELVETATLKSQLGQTRAAEAAIGADDLWAEGADNFGVDGLAGLHQLPAQFIGFDHVGAQFAQVARDSAFAAAQAAGEPDAKHELTPPPHAGCSHGVGHEHGDGERTDATGNGRIGAGELEGFGVDVADDCGAAL